MQRIKTTKFKTPTIKKEHAKSAMYLVIIVAILIFGSKIMKFIGSFIPSDVKGEAKEDQQFQLATVSKALDTETKKTKLSMPEYKYAELAINIYNILDNRNYLTGSYNNFQLRQQFYLLQNTADWLKLQLAFGVKPLQYGFLPPRTADISIIKLGILLDQEDKDLLNKRFQEKKIAFSFT